MVLPFFSQMEPQLCRRTLIEETKSHKRSGRQNGEDDEGRQNHEPYRCLPQRVAQKGIEAEQEGKEKSEGSWNIEKGPRHTERPDSEAGINKLGCCYILHLCP